MKTTCHPIALFELFNWKTLLRNSKKILDLSLLLIKNIYQVPWHVRYYYKWFFRKPGYKRVTTSIMIFRITCHCRCNKIDIVRIPLYFSVDNIAHTSQYATIWTGQSPWTWQCWYVFQKFKICFRPTFKI